MSDLSEAVDLLEFWFDMEADRVADDDDDDETVPEYKNVIRAALLLVKTIRSAEHTAWCRFAQADGQPARITLCGSGDPKAFKVYRSPIILEKP